jgi:hypothetical protein
LTTNPLSAVCSAPAQNSALPPERKKTKTEEGANRNGKRMRKISGDKCMSNDKCKYCGAVGPCYVECDCSKCRNPRGYYSYIRNQPGNWRSKAVADRLNRECLESCGQITFEQAIAASENKTVNAYLAFLREQSEQLGEKEFLRLLKFNTQLLMRLNEWILEHENESMK